MVEAVYVGPGNRVVAGFAAEQRAVGALAPHAVVKFSMMRIGVARSAGHVGKTERQHFVGAMRFACSVATRARDGSVSARQGKARVAMRGDGVQGAMEIRDGVAGFATIVERRRGELIVVHVLVAVGAIRKLDLVLRIFAGRNVTVGALDRDVFAFQRIL